MISEELKAEAKGHGIVPGAVIYCAADPYSYGTVAPYSEWETGGGPPYLIVGIDDEGADLFALYEYDWATPTRTLNFLTPAQFLTRLEHTSPPVKELTTEEKLKEAVRLLKNCYSIALFEDYNEARAFLKSIKS